MYPPRKTLKNSVLRKCSEIKSEEKIHSRPNSTTFLPLQPISEGYSATFSSFQNTSERYSKLFAIRQNTSPSLWQLLLTSGNLPNGFCNPSRIPKMFPTTSANFSEPRKFSQRLRQNFRVSDFIPDTFSKIFGHPIYFPTASAPFPGSILTSPRRFQPFRASEIFKSAAAIFQSLKNSPHGFCKIFGMPKNFPTPFAPFPSRKFFPNGSYNFFRNTQNTPNNLGDLYQAPKCWQPTSATLFDNSFKV